MSKFTRYDSAIFPTIEESILHSQTNPFVSKNFSRKIHVNYKDTSYVISEPLSAMKLFLENLSEFFINEIVRDEENYLPERTALRIYGSHDFWFLIMILNSIESVTSYNKGKEIKIIPPDQLFRIEKFLVRETSPIQEIDSTTIIFK